MKSPFTVEDSNFCDAIWISSFMTQNNLVFESSWVEILWLIADRKYVIRIHGGMTRWRRHDSYKSRQLESYRNCKQGGQDWTEKSSNIIKQNAINPFNHCILYIRKWLSINAVLYDLWHWHVGTSRSPEPVRCTLYSIFKKDYNTYVCRDNSQILVNLDSALKNLVT